MHLFISLNLIKIRNKNASFLSSAMIIMTTICLSYFYNFLIFFFKCFTEWKRLSNATIFDYQSTFSSCHLLFPLNACQDTQHLLRCMYQVSHFSIYCNANMQSCRKRTSETFFIFFYFQSNCNSLSKRLALYSFQFISIIACFRGLDQVERK